jgi:hypothetical protein
LENESLAIKIKNGNESLLPELYSNVYLLICQQANNRINQAPKHMADLIQDLIQSGYFAVLDAVKAYDPATGYKFTTYLNYPLKNRFDECLGIRTKRGKNDAMHGVTSLDKELSSESDITLNDILLDPESETAFNNICDTEFWKSTNIILREAIYQSCIDPIRSALMAMLDYDITLSAAAKLLSYDLDLLNGQYSRAKIKLKYYLTGKAKQQCIYAGIFDYFNQGVRATGLQAYKNRGFTSIVESLAIRRIDGY